MLPKTLAEMVGSPEPGEVEHFRLLQERRQTQSAIRDAAFREGAWARGRGFGRDTNPFDPSEGKVGRDLYDQWDDGWREAGGETAIVTPGK